MNSEYQTPIQTLHYRPAGETSFEWRSRWRANRGPPSYDCWVASLGYQLHTTYYAKHDIYAKQRHSAVFNCLTAFGSTVIDGEPTPHSQWVSRANKLKKLSEHDQEMPQSQTTYQPTSPQGRDMEQQQPHDSKNTFKIKLPAFSPSVRIFQN